MDARSHGVLVNAAGFLYASLGFSLSVLAALFSIFHRNEVKSPSPQKLAKPHPQSLVGRARPSSRPSRPQRQPVLQRSVSDQPVKSPPFSFSSQRVPEPTIEAKMRRQMLASHRRSRSIPVITVAFYGSTDALSLRQPLTPTERLAADSPLIDAPLPPLPKPRRLTFVINAPPERDPRPPPIPESDRPAFRLSNLWIKDKDKDRPRLDRRQSSPQLRPLPKSPMPQFVCPKSSHKVNSSDETLSDSSKSNLSKLTRRKPLRKSPSAAEEKLTKRFDPSFTRVIEKKKSLPLRTQPYEAPYFAPPPVPILPASLRSTTASSPESKSIHKQPSKSRTLK